MKLLTVIGTRPQFIKYAAISCEIRRNFSEILVDTGQHYSYELSAQFLHELGIPRPEYELVLNSMQPAKQLSEMIIQLDEIILHEKPSYLLCFGDTNSALAASIAALKNEISIIHIEGGERNFTKDFARVPVSSIPEEANRLIIDSVSEIVLCASQQAVRNLSSENFQAKYAFTGDITFDLYKKTLGIAIDAEILKKMNLRKKEFIFCTFHRALNTDHKDRLDNIITALGESGENIVLPLHPRTKKMLHHFQLDHKIQSYKNIKLIEPLGYIDSIILNSNSKLVITDSGGVLREAYFNKVPSLLLDDTTEWIDLVINQCCEIVGASHSSILLAINKKWDSKFEGEIFGDGNAVMRIIERIKEWTDSAISKQS